MQIHLKKHLRRTMMLGLVIVFAAGLAHAQESADSYDAPILAVSPFEYDAGLPTYKWIGEYLADTVSAELSGVPGLKVVERGQIEKLFEEMKLSLSGFSEEDVEFGGLNVASHLVLGRYRIEGDEIHAAIKLVEVSSGGVVAGQTVSTEREALTTLGRKIQGVILQGLKLGPPSSARMAPELSLGHHRNLRRARELWDELPFHELHPRRRRRKIDFQRAVDTLEGLLMEEPGHMEAYFLTGQFYLQLGRHEEAASYFDVLLSEGGDQVRGNLGYGDLERFRRNADKALDYYNEALSWQKHNPGALYGRAKCLLDMDSYEQAAEALLKLQEVSPGLKVVSSLISVSIDRMGTERINRNLEQPVFAALAGTIAVHRADMCSAARYFDTAAEVFPDLYLLEYSRAACNFSQGKLGQAEQSLNRAKQLYPEYPPIHKLYGELAMQQERWAEAVSFFRTYMNLSTGGADFTEVRNKIDYCRRRM